MNDKRSIAAALAVVVALAALAFCGQTAEAGEPPTLLVEVVGVTVTASEADIINGTPAPAEMDKAFYVANDGPNAIYLRAYGSMDNQTWVEKAFTVVGPGELGSVVVKHNAMTHVKLTGETWRGTSEACAKLYLEVPG